MKFKIIGVRFSKRPEKIWTYKIRNSTKVYLGQKLIADSEYGSSVVFVVKINPPIPEGYSIETLTEITECVKEL